MKVDFWISLSHRRLPLKWQTHENTKAAFLKTYWNKHTHSHKHACSHSGNFVLFESKRTVCCLQNKQVHDPHNSIWILSENAWITAYLCMFLFSYSSQFSFYKSGPFCQWNYTAVIYIFWGPFFQEWLQLFFLQIHLYSTYSM